MNLEYFDIHQRDTCCRSRTFISYPAEHYLETSRSRTTVSEAFIAIFSTAGVGFLSRVQVRSSGEIANE